MKKQLRELLIEKRKQLSVATEAIDKLILQPITPKSPKQKSAHKFHIDNPQIDDLQHYSLSQFSVDQIDETINKDKSTIKKKVKTNEARSRSQAIERSAINQTREAYLKNRVMEEQMLNFRAKEFVRRMRKQKQYVDGKFLIKKRKQQQERIKRNQQEVLRRERYNLIKLEIRKNEALDKVITFKKKAANRLAISLDLGDHEANQGSKVNTYQTEPSSIPSPMNSPNVRQIKKQIANSHAVVNPQIITKKKDMIKDYNWKKPLKIKQNPLIRSLKSRLIELQRSISRINKER